VTAFGRIGPPPIHRGNAEPATPDGWPAGRESPADERLVRLHSAALFRFDADDFLVAVNERGWPPPPRLFVARSVGAPLVRVARDLPPGIVAGLRALLANEPAGTVLDGSPPHLAEAIRAVLADHRPVGTEWRGPAFAFPPAWRYRRRRPGSGPCWSMRTPRPKPKRRLGIDCPTSRRCVRA